MRHRHPQIHDSDCSCSMWLGNGKWVYPAMLNNPQKLQSMPSRTRTPRGFSSLQLDRDRLPITQDVMGIGNKRPSLW